jgi:hypothetical protein
MLLYARRVYREKRHLLPSRGMIRAGALLMATTVLLLLTGTVNAQTGLGQITVSACQDQNADGHWEQKLA